MFTVRYLNILSSFHKLNWSLPIFNTVCWTPNISFRDNIVYQKTMSLTTRHMCFWRLNQFLAWTSSQKKFKLAKCKIWNLFKNFGISVYIRVSRFKPLFIFSLEMLKLCFNLQLSTNNVNRVPWLSWKSFRELEKDKMSAWFYCVIWLCSYVTLLACCSLTQ